MTEWAFRVGFAILLTHELDAVARSEWRVLPFTSFLDDAAGMIVFVLLHVPLFAWLLGRVGHADQTLRRRWQGFVSMFMIVHVGLHLAFTGHAHYDFHSWMSKLLIFGAGAFGAVHLVLRGREAGARS